MYNWRKGGFMKLIFAVDNNFSMGLKGDMLFHLRKDLKRFKSITMGNILVMGRKTLESLPGSKPLEGRTHIVLTRNKDYKNGDAHIINSLDDLDQLIESLNPQKDKEVFLIGGGDLVGQLIDKCDTAYITKVDKTYSSYDTQIPNLDELDEWKLVEKSEVQVEEQKNETFHYTYNKYKRI